MFVQSITWMNFERQTRTNLHTMCYLHNSIWTYSCFWEECILRHPVGLHYLCGKYENYYYMTTCIRNTICTWYYKNSLVVPRSTAFKWDIASITEARPLAHDADENNKTKNTTLLSSRPFKLYLRGNVLF